MTASKSPVIQLSRILKAAQDASATLPPDRSIQEVRQEPKAKPTHAVVVFRDGTELHISAWYSK